MRARSGCADCALVTRAVYDAHPPDPARARGDVPRHGLSLLASSQKKLGLADRLRARSAARKTNHSHGLRTGRAMRRERRAADAPCGRFAFLKRPRRGPAAGQPVMLRCEPLFVGRMLGRDRRVSCRDGTLHLLLRRSLWHRGSELPRKSTLRWDGRKAPSRNTRVDEPTAPAKQTFFDK